MSSNYGSDSPQRGRNAASALQRETLLAVISGIFTSSSFFLIQYDRLRNSGPSLQLWVHDVLGGMGFAPGQYRVGLPLLILFFERVVGLRPNQSLPLIEFVFYALSTVALYLLFRHSPQAQVAERAPRLVQFGLFFTAMQFPVLWIFPWDRPETIPTVFYLAAIVLLVACYERIPFLATCVVAVLLSSCQALLRADVPVVVGLAIILAAASGIQFPRRSSATAFLGVLCLVAGGTCQFYMQHVAYPSAVYPPGTPKFQLFANLNLRYAPIHLPDALTALLPLAVTLVLIRQYRLHLESSDKLALLICILYLPVWATLGLVAEVRIFVPFLFLAAPTTAKVWGNFLCQEGQDAAGKLPRA